MPLSISSRPFSTETTLHGFGVTKSFNQHGGDMVITTIHTKDKTVATKKVWASVGKYARAEPISALYEQKKVHHVGMFAALEDELCSWVPGEGLPSPNRLDALVWALTELMLGEAPAPGLVRAGDVAASERAVEGEQLAPCALAR